MPHPQPIETRYQGYRFRSRLEARWAVFFDALGCAWEYEKEGFDLGGVWYLPDFWLEDIACYAEVKPTTFSEQELWKARQCGCILLEGVPEVRLYTHAKVLRYFLSDGTLADLFYHPVHLPKSLQEGRLWYGHGQAISDYDNASFHRAVNAARGARFEHGERGNFVPGTLPRTLSNTLPSSLQPKRPERTLIEQNNYDVSQRMRDLILKEGRRTYDIDFTRDLIAMSRINDSISNAMKELRGLAFEHHTKGVHILLPFLSVNAPGNSSRFVNFELRITPAMIAGLPG